MSSGLIDTHPTGVQVTLAASGNTRGCLSVQDTCPLYAHMFAHEVRVVINTRMCL